MNNSISEQLFKVTRRKKIPLIVNFEVTHRCNLNCLHCYHIDNRNCDKEELDSSEIRKLLILLKEAGTMFLVITGGEPFMRKDIVDILRMIKELGFIVIIFTNGTLINKEQAELISEVVPFTVHISLYSIRPDIHDKITGVQGSFEKTIKGLELIREKGINPVIKCPVMKENVDSIDELKSWGEKQNFIVKIDPFISPCYEHNALSINMHRIPVDMINEIITDKRFFNIENFKHRKDMECSAGFNMAGIDSSGNVFPCIVWRKKSGNVRTEKFIDIWSKMSPDYSEFEECRVCSKFAYCGVCAGIAAIEGKDVFCQMAEAVRSRIEAEPRFKKEMA